MTSPTITIPAREVRPGDVLFGMTVTEWSGTPAIDRYRFLTSNDAVLYLPLNMQVTVERPVPSDPIGTVRARFIDGICTGVYRKGCESVWFLDGVEYDYTDAGVADLPILWKPGMPIPNTEVTA